MSSLSIEIISKLNSSHQQSDDVRIFHAQASVKCWLSNNALTTIKEIDIFIGICSKLTFMLLRLLSISQKHCTCLITHFPLLSSHQAFVTD